MTHENSGFDFNANSKDTRELRMQLNSRLDLGLDSGLNLDLTKH